MTPDAWPRERDVAVGIVRDAAVLARAIEQEIDRTVFLEPDLSSVTSRGSALDAIQHGVQP